MHECVVAANRHTYSRKIVQCASIYFIGESEMGRERERDGVAQQHRHLS